MVVLFLAVLAGACTSGNDSSTVTNTGSGNTGNESNNADGSNSGNTSNTNFGSNGLPAFRVRTNNTAFTLEEGTSITIPLAIDRVNGHSNGITLSVNQQSLSDQRVQTNFAQNFINPTDAATTAAISFLHGQKRAAEQQRSLTITANDGETISELEVLLNIRPTSARDIYLLVGQSNMVGFSEFNAKDISAGGADERHPSIKQLNVTANDTVTFDTVSRFGDPAAQIAFPDFVLAEDPLHTSKDPSLDSKVGTQVGLGLSFAKRALVNDGTHEIILVPAAWSSTGFCNTGAFLSSITNAPTFIAAGALGWNAFAKDDSTFGGTTLFNRAVLRANLAIQRSGGILRGILWHQGESDSDNVTCAAAYAENLATLASELRTRIIPDARGVAARGASSDVPFIAGTMSRGSDFRGDFSFISDSKQQVDETHRNIGAQGVIPFYGIALLDDITPGNGYPCGEGSCVHFGSEAYREMGNRYYQELEAVLSRP